MYLPVDFSKKIWSKTVLSFFDLSDYCNCISENKREIQERSKQKKEKSDCERKCLYTKLITTQKSESCFCLISLIDFEPSQQPKRTMMKKYIENIILLSHKDSSILELKKFRYA